MTDEGQKAYLKLDEDPPLGLVFVDRHLLLVNKPAGQLFHGYTKGKPLPLVDQLKGYLKAEKGSEGNVYLGVVHRLDRPVSGLAVLARNSKAAARLSEQFQERSVDKIYLALVEKSLEEKSGQLRDELEALPSSDRTRNKEGSQLCVLDYQQIASNGAYSLLAIRLGTGRRHQIRQQLAKRGCPIVGDLQYGAQAGLMPEASDARFAAIALHAHSLRLKHPLSYEIMQGRAALPFYWQNLPLAREAQEYEGRWE